MIYITIMLAEQNRRKDKLKARQKKNTCSCHVFDFDCKVRLRDGSVWGVFMTDVIFFKEMREGSF